MNLSNPYYLILLLICLGLLLLVLKRGKRLLNRYRAYAEPQLHNFYYRDRSPFWIGFRLFLSVLTLALIIIAMVRPQWDFERKDVQSSGMDIIFAIDVSKSMDATDMMPTRLMRAILQISGFVQQLKTDRIGIIAFAGVATLECPLTDDYEAVKIVLSSLNSNTIDRPGTNIGAALELSEKAFAAASKANSLILISDGEDLEGTAIQQAKRLKDKGIRIHSMGVGSPEGVIITNPDTKQEVVSKLDEKTLQQIADLTDGEYYRVTPGGDEIRLILQRIYETEESRIRNKRLSLQKEQYYLFALLAIALLLVEAVISPRKRNSGVMAAEKHSEI